GPLGIWATKRHGCLRLQKESGGHKRRASRPSRAGNGDNPNPEIGERDFTDMIVAEKGYGY
ncbi:12190_t:CDS:2, partial [Funneliformis geosporum]